MVKPESARKTHVRNSARVQRRHLRLSGGVSVELLLNGRNVVGLGGVKVGAVPLRSGTVPLRPDFSTPDAIHYMDFELARVARRDGAVVIETTAIGRPEVSGEMMDEYSYNLAFPAVRSERRDALDWVLTPRELDLDGQHFAGLSIGFRFRSRASRIHKLTVFGTWEIGGRAAGNTIYHQAYTCPPVYTATKANRFSTSCLKRLDLWSDWLGHSYQMLPRWGAIQPFDFQTAREGVLLGFWNDPHSVKSLIQKNPGEDVIFVLDEYDVPLASTADFPAKWVLFSPSPDARKGRPKHEAVDLWTRACDHTAGIIRGFFGIKPCEPLLTGTPAYTGRNSVAREELAGGRKRDWLWRAENGKFYFLLEGDRIESHDFLYWLADKKLPQLRAQGVTRVTCEPVHESDFTELAFAYHAETGWHGDLFVASICGSQRYRPAPFYDGWRGWRYLAGKARRLGMDLGHWVGLHLTPRSPILREHPEYILQHVNTLGHGGGYSHMGICSINWCSGARKWFLDDFRRWHDEGLQWLFFDSWPNLGCTPLNYGGRMEPMQWELGRVLAGLQRIGYDWFSFEGTSPFGVHQYGLWDPMREYEKHVSGGVAGQNDFAWWIGHEYMGYNQILGPNINPKRDRRTLAEMSFRYAANRSLTLVQKHHYDLYPYVDGLDHTYAALQPLMRKRFLLPDDRGVRWEARDGREVVWSYRSFAHVVPEGAAVARIRNGAAERVACTGGVLRTEPWTAYRIG
ncbi:MAG: hypothetical protein NTW87_10510 [Planctomycetota bacterium]|nr:hypothetical protein [Planctomycetota bacterium]